MGVWEFTFNKAKGLSNNLLHYTVNKIPECMTKLFISHRRLILDFCSQDYNVRDLGDSRIIESVHRRLSVCVEGMGEYRAYKFEVLALVALDENHKGAKTSNVLCTIQ